jgi:CheY-like chemotaxis protein
MSNHGTESHGSLGDSRVAKAREMPGPVVYTLTRALLFDEERRVFVMKPDINEARLRVLVVDDNESIREVIKTLLSLEGHRCESAANGREAMEKVSQSKFDVVITDIHMPEMDGITLTGELTRRFAGLPVMIITAQLDEYTRELALTAGAKDVIEKSFAIPELTGRLQRMLHA